MSSIVDEIEGYIKAKEVDVIFKAMLVKCFRERPTSPIEFMMDYLIAQYPDVAAKRFGNIVAAENSSDGCAIKVLHSDPEVSTYLQETLDVGSLFEYVSDQLIECRPKDPLGFIVSTLVFAKENEDTEYSITEEEELMEDLEEEDELKEEESMAEMKTFAKPRTARVRRPSVSAECISFKEDEKIEKKKFEKTEAERESIRVSVKENLLFKDLESVLKEEVVDAVFPVEHKEGSTIIRQGDEGDNFYIVESGECEVLISKKGGAVSSVASAGPGTSFGELALMYNSPRAATVKAKTDVKLWALDRQTFRATLSDSTRDRRMKHQNFLEKVQILESLTEAERAIVADTVETCTFASGEQILEQGAPGDRFYILEEGSAKALIGKNPVKSYQPGDYFGELALLTNAPRAASVVATSECTCISMDRAAFRRVLGPCQEILQRKASTYRKALEQS
ncbi:hypothetical protein CYMTET_16728 [Cymbomonas tetramitiformis]|uniref:cGMP-dependent protein kinase n=1 Tax=Cymbomonas tetramitiformis TaxID=36881 RepID=A0AAE0GBM0_9CHLO|nr:hypothetical protein CYMTET_16728 [Cymbomonas tetramitiformis]